jgi:hypothetical protein
MSGLVETKHEMLRAGYKSLGRSKCKGCGAAIEWWNTTNNKRIPYNPLPESDHSRVMVHWATCPKADDFRGGASVAPAAKPAPQPNIDAHQKYLAAFRASSNARVVVAIFEDGTAAAWRKGIAAEDLRQDLIGEANNIRNHILKENDQ